MKMLDVQIALEDLRKAREQWAQARAEFQSGYEWVFTRLVHEGARNYMTVSQIAIALGVTPKAVRNKMRAIGLDPKAGKRMLSKTASHALLENAAIMGIEPAEMDLTSPLAYLPMGEQMRKQYQDRTLVRVTEEPEVSGNITQDRLYQAIISVFEGVGEAWTTSESGDTLARAAAEAAMREINPA